MKRKLAFSIICLTIFFTVSCNKTGNNVAPDTTDPNNADLMTEVLIIPNAQLIKDATMPASSAPGIAPVVTNNDVSVSYSSGSQIILPIDVSAPTSANIAGVYIQIDGASSYQKIPIAPTASSGTFSIPITIPAHVASGSFSYTYKFYDASGNVSAPHTISVTITPSENCNKTKVSGGQGVTSTTFDLKDKPGVVKIQFETYTVPDKIDVFQNGKWIGGTGPAAQRQTLRKALNCNQATEALGYIGAKGEFNFPYDPAGGNKVEVVVSGCENGGTAWQYTISCPTEAPSANFTFDFKTYTFPIAGYAFTSDGIYSAGGLLFATQGIRYDSQQDNLLGNGNVLGLGFTSADSQGLIMKNGQLTEDDIHTLFFMVGCNNSTGIGEEDCGIFYDESDVKSGSVRIRKTGINIYELKLDITFDDGKKLAGSYNGSYNRW